ncbi:MAG: hypothetical protein ACTSQF_14630, partial [Candidatus Heimdallarchaeaceae archaeon]
MDDKKDTLLSKAIDLYFTRKFDEALEILENKLIVETDNAAMWKLIVLAEKEGENVLEKAKQQYSIAKETCNDIMEIGSLCAHALSLQKIRQFEETIELAKQAREKISNLHIEMNFELERLDLLIKIIQGAAHLGTADFKKAAKHFETVYFSRISNKYLWQKLRTAYAILFGERDNKASPKLLKIAEEAVRIAQELDIGDNIRIHYRNLVRLQASLEQLEEAKETYAQMFSSYKRSSVTPTIIEEFTL